MLDDLLIRSFIAGIGVAIIAAPLGCFVVWRRMAYFGEAIAYGGLLGVALGFALSVDLMTCIVGASVFIALLLLALRRQRLLPSDTLLGIIAHTALAFGLIIAHLTAGRKIDLTGYLFGDILIVSKRELLWILAGAAIVWLTMLVLWRPLLSASVNEEIAAAEGAPIGLINFVFILLLALTVALGMKIVGVVLITSLLVIPAAAARAFAATPEQMALAASIIAILSVLAGLETSRWVDIPAGPSIIAALSLLFAVGVGKMALGRRRK